MTGEAVLVGLLGELIGVDCNVEPMRDVYPHKRARNVLVAIDYPLFELTISPCSKEVDTICHVVHGVEEGLDGNKKRKPDHHVLGVLHVRRKCRGSFLLTNPPPHGKVACHGSEHGGEGLEIVPKLRGLGRPEMFCELNSVLGQVAIHLLLFVLWNCVSHKHNKGHTMYVLNNHTILDLDGYVFV